MERDMTVGKPMRIILNFTLPIFIGNVFQQFYSMVDTVIVGKFVGTKALAGVGSTGTIMFLILGFLTGFTVGVTVITAQRYGAGNMGAMRKTVASAALLSAAVSVVMTAASMIFMKPLLIAMNTPADIFDDAYNYIIIICAGIAAQVLYNLLSSILRALGNSKTPLYFLILAALLNVVLDLVFIIVFKMGTAGAAWATVISQGVSGLLCLVYIIKKVPVLRLKKEDWVPNVYTIRSQLSVGLPMGLQYSITAIGTIMVQSSLNILGSTAVAAFTAASKIEQIVTQAYVSLGTTMSTFCAQNAGASRYDRIRKGFISADIIGFIYAVVAGALIMFLGKYLTGMFISEGIDEIVPMVDTYLKCVGAFFIPLTVVNVYRNGIQGMGYGLLPMTAGIAELAGRGIVAVIAASYSSYIGICMANPAAWIFAALLLLGMYAYIMKKHHPLQRKDIGKNGDKEYKTMIKLNESM